MKKKTNLLASIVINIPIINVLSAMSVSLIQFSGFHLGEVRVLIFFSIIFFVLLKFGLNQRILKWMLFFLFYLLLLVFYSSDFNYSFFGTYLKVVVTMLMFPVGFYVINDMEKLFKFLKSFLYAGLLLCINYIFAQYFKIGRSVYLEDSFYYGYAGIGSTVVLTYLLLTAPLSSYFVKTNKDKLLVWSVVILSIIFTIVALKRIAILALVIGFMVYLIKSGRLKKGFKLVILIFMVLIITAPIYLDLFEARLAARTSERNELTREGRYFDILNAINHFHTKGLKHALIGSELFNTPGYFGRNRQVHVDYANLLIGSGIIGLVLYIIIHLILYNNFKKVYRKLKKNSLHLGKSNSFFLKDINGVFYAILIASLVVSLSGGLHVITTRSIVFVILGSCFGILQNTRKNILKKNSDKNYFDRTDTITQIIR